jgi:hypothetical protein
MRDPSPENISGEKVQRHVFKHEINWGHVAVAVAVIVVAGKLLGEEKDEEEPTRTEL